MSPKKRTRISGPSGRDAPVSKRRKDDPIRDKAEFLVANFTNPITKSGSHITSCGHPEQAYLTCNCR